MTKGNHMQTINPKGFGAEFNAGASASVPDVPELSNPESKMSVGSKSPGSMGPINTTPKGAQ